MTCINQTNQSNVEHKKLKKKKQVNKYLLGNWLGTYLILIAAINSFLKIGRVLTITLVLLNYFTTGWPVKDGVGLLLNECIRFRSKQKYAPLFDQEKVGMIELPYLTEERLHKMGIPMGPRIRILQEAQICIRTENLSDYGMVWAAKTTKTAAAALERFIFLQQFLCNSAICNDGQRHVTHVLALLLFLYMHKAILQYTVEIHFYKKSTCLLH